MPILRIPLPHPDATSRYAKTLATRLAAGDVILLHGHVGAGKTHFARSLIQSLLESPEDVPSPTFTLVQTYDTVKGEVWHADLYRITSPDEIEELGLVDAFHSAICLIEWPDRLGVLAQNTGLDITLTSGLGENEREMNVEWHDPKWGDKLTAWRP
ncbi:MAG: tRNA (adenosine(37)-N6)-threonylcarbamoyltransferase complex ATPase subunit type 1 TsaE [Sulfitobacter sp.]